MRQFLQWFFRNRETGEVTIAQAPNLVLWVVIAAGALLWVLPSSGNPSVALGIVFKGGLVVWAVDEVFRGVNPWRRCLGAAVFGCELTTFYDRLSGMHQAAAATALPRPERCQPPNRPGARYRSTTGS